jgi:hypothetical protein
MIKMPANMMRPTRAAIECHKGGEAVIVIGLFRELFLFRRRDLGMSARKNIHPIAKFHSACGHDAHIDSPEVSVPQFLQPDQAQRVRSKTGTIFLAAIVRLRRDFQQRLAHSQPASGRQIAGRQIKIQNQAISEKSEGLAIGDQLRHALLHDGDLHIAFAALRAAPCIARNAFIGLQDSSLKRLASTAFAPAHQQGNLALLLRRGRHGVQHLH